MIWNFYVHFSEVTTAPLKEARNLQQIFQSPLSRMGESCGSFKAAVTTISYMPLKEKRDTVLDYLL